MKALWKNANQGGIFFESELRRDDYLGRVTLEPGFRA